MIFAYVMFNILTMIVLSPFLVSRYNGGHLMLYCILSPFLTPLLTWAMFLDGSKYLSRILVVYGILLCWAFAYFFC